MFYNSHFSVEFIFMTDILKQVINSCQRNLEATLHSIVPSKVSPNAIVDSIRLSFYNRKCVPILCIAASCGSFDVVKYLVMNGANIESHDNVLLLILLFIYLFWCSFAFFYNPIHWAAMAGHNMILSYLLETPIGKQLIVRDKTPLLLATRNGRTDCVQVLLKYGVDSNVTDIAVHFYFLDLFYSFKNSFAFSMLVRAFRNCKVTAEHKS